MFAVMFMKATRLPRFVLFAESAQKNSPRWKTEYPSRKGIIALNNIEEMKL